MNEEKVVGVTEQTLTAEPVDLTGTQEDLVGHKDLTNHELHVAENVTPEDHGKEEAAKVRDPEDITEKELDQGFYDETTVKPKKDIPVEYPIEYLFNPNNKKIFPVNEAIVKQKHLIPCTKEGKLLPDNRRPSDFR